MRPPRLGTTPCNGAPREPSCPNPLPTEPVRSVLPGSSVDSSPGASTPATRCTPRDCSCGGRRISRCSPQLTPASLRQEHLHPGTEGARCVVLIVIFVGAVSGVLEGIAEIHGVGEVAAIDTDRPVALGPVQVGIADP